MKHRSQGYTLMEVLVVLAITGMVSGVLLQALSQVYRLQERFGLQLLRSEAGTMQTDWYRQLVQGLQPDLPDGPDRFRGDERGFQALAMDPFSREQGVPRPVALTVHFDSASGATGLKLRMQGREVSLAAWPELTSAAFLYVDAKGEPHDHWPPPLGAWPALPTSVHLRLKAVRDEQLIVAVPRVNFQPQRQADIMGESP